MMKPFLYKNCRFYGFDLSVPAFVPVFKSQVSAEMKGGRVRYFIKGKPDVIIVQALNLKKASAKFLTMISRKAA